MNQRMNGFTLVELLMAVTISALVLTGAFISLSVVLQAYKEQAGKASTNDIARLILDRMRKDLQSAYYSPHEDRTRFVGMDEQNGAFATDTLTFISTINNPTEMGGGTSDLTEIQYFIDLDSSTPEKWLVRRYDPTPDIDPFSGGQISLLGPKVVHLDLLYFDGEMWWPEWDSTSDLPIAVYITLGIFNPEQMGDEPTEDTIEQFSTNVWIACAKPSTGGMTEEGEAGSGEGSGSGSTGGGGSGGR